MNRHSEPNKQNGGHLPLESAKPVLPTDNRICRDYVWGKCTKYSQCKFSHECDIESMKAIIQFCHDFQNTTGCNRRNCTYIHATSAEEILFREAGQIPADLAKRYAQIDAIFLANNMKRNPNYPSKPPPPPPENQPPLETRPPPPPPPPTGASAYQPRWFPMLPPPPPPPPPREPSHTCPPPNNVPVYTHQQQPPPHIPLIDTSRPPPPLPTCIDRFRLASVKRPIEDSTEAGPSKARKTQDVAASPCDHCTQWDIRNLVLERKIQEKIAEKAMLVLKIEKDRKECKRISELLLAIFGGMSTAMHPSTSSSSPKDSYDIIQGVISSKLIADTPELTPYSSQSPMFRFLNDILKESEGSALSSSSNVLNNELETLFKTESSLNLDNILSLSSNASASTSSALLSSSILGQSLQTPTHLPPPHAHSSHQNYHPHDQLQYSFTGNLSNGAGESTLPKTATSSTPSVPMTTATLPPPYISQSNYHYNMMGRPPPFQ